MKSLLNLNEQLNYEMLTVYEASQASECGFDFECGDARVQAIIEWDETFTFDKGDYIARQTFGDYRLS